MRSLVVFIWKHHFALLFLMLEGISFLMVVRGNYFHRASVINSSSAASAWLLNSVHEFKSYFNLKNVNKVLLTENAWLRSRPGNMTVTEVDKDSLKQDSSFASQYTYVVAEIINSSHNKRNNVFTMNKGSMHGIAQEMGVITHNGIIGVVKNVSEHYCTVQSLLHKNTMISAKIKRTGDFGILAWPGNDPGTVLLTDISRHVRLSEGDTVVSRGGSALFPEGIPIGAVSVFKEEEGSDYYTITVQLFINFRNLSYGYFVKNRLGMEQINLEKLSADD